MHRVRRYISPFIADRAAEFLREKGIPAAVVGHHVSAVWPIDALKFAQVELVVASRHHRARALELLPEFHESLEEEGAIAPDPGWESEATPDLNALDPALEIRCPQCQYELAIDERVNRCPECGAAFDALDLIIDQHGPEALASCYPNQEDDSAIDLTTCDLPCTSCRYSLGGLPTRGRCPECGELYDKEEIIGKMI